VNARVLLVEICKARGRPASRRIASPSRCLLRATSPGDGDDGVPWSAKSPRATGRQRWSPVWISRRLMRPSPGALWQAPARRALSARTHKSQALSGSLGDLPPSPPAEKATARQDQAGQASTSDGSGDTTGMRVTSEDVRLESEWAKADIDQACCDVVSNGCCDVSANRGGA
jgi:hypothetical protein